MDVRKEKDSAVADCEAKRQKRTGGQNPPGYERSLNQVHFFYFTRPMLCGSAIETAGK